jgi:hypothetical protein
MENFDVDEVFNQYNENSKLQVADIFHLYDTGMECMNDNSGYHDSRHFILVAYNTETMQKRHYGIHDGIENRNDNNVIRTIRIFADGSFFVRFKKPVDITEYQCITLY